MDTSSKSFFVLEEGMKSGREVRSYARRLIRAAAEAKVESDADESDL